jgi:hypothetical protein
MPFIKLSKGTQERVTTPHEEEVRMGSHRTEGGRTIYISVSDTLVAKLGWEIGRSERGAGRKVVDVAVNEGVGNDAGFWLVSPDPKGFRLGTQAKLRGAYASNISYTKLRHYVLNDDDVSVHPVDFTIESGALLLQVPDWLRYNPQSYQEPEKPKLTQPPTQPLPTKEDKKPARPTLSRSEDIDKINVEVVSDRELRLNREQRRRAAAHIARSMRH